MPNIKKIGGYSILGEIGSGAVYRARDTLNDRDLALKILPPTDAPDDLERFRREARLAREIDHPNVIRVFDCGEDGGVRFIAMELMAVSLREVLAKGRLSLSRSLDIFRQAALGLRAVHERGRVHGDVKPDSVLLDSAGEVKVAGFSSARADDLTMTAYKPPELWRGERADVRLRRLFARSRASRGADRRSAVRRRRRIVDKTGSPRRPDRLGANRRELHGTRPKTPLADDGRAD